MIINTEHNDFNLINPENRKHKGFGVSPYSPRSLLRYFLNSITNGRFSYRNPDREKMHKLSKSGHVNGTGGEGASSLKVVFLGDIMVSRSGKPPHLKRDLKRILKKADIIVANVESPIVQKAAKRGLSLNFGMESAFLAKIHSCNSAAKWVFSIANNHACDTSRMSSEDVRGIETTIKMIHEAIPDAEIIGAELEEAHPVLSLHVEEGPTIGIVGWTELMNHDKEHYKKPIIRETDLTDKKVKRIKKRHDMLIGFAHGNEEQSYYPLKETRDRWLKPNLPPTSLIRL